MKPALQAIARNIAKYGHHVYLVWGNASPRFSYTIGLSETLGPELVFAGGAFYEAVEVHRLVDDIARLLVGGAPLDSVLEVGTLGSFHLRKVCPDWVRALMLGALDYYKDREVSAYQIVPDKDHWTIDVPNLESPWSATSEPIWQWHFEEWPFSVPRDSIAATNLKALRGQRITQAARWEDELWEIFAGGEVTEEELRPVPLGVLLGADDSLRAVLDLGIGKGLLRDEDELAWRPWLTLKPEPG